MVETLERCRTAKLDKRHPHKSFPVEELTYPRVNFVQWICFTILLLNEYSELIYISIIRMGSLALIIANDSVLPR